MSSRKTLKSHLVIAVNAFAPETDSFSQKSIGNYGNGKCGSLMWLPSKIIFARCSLVEAIKLHYAQAFDLSKIGKKLTQHCQQMYGWSLMFTSRIRIKYENIYIRLTHVWIGKQKPYSISYFLLFMMFFMEISSKSNCPTLEWTIRLRCKMKIAKWIFAYVLISMQISS